MLSVSHCTFNRTSIVSVLPQYMQGLCFDLFMISQQAKHMMKSRPDRAKPNTAPLHSNTGHRIVEHRFPFWRHHTPQTPRNCYAMFYGASQHHLWVGSHQVYAFCHSYVRRRSRGYDASLSRRCDQRPQVVQRSVAPNGHVLIRQHVLHRNKSCFDLTACVVFDRLHTENEFTFGDKRVALDAVELCRRQHRFSL